MITVENRRDLNTALRHIATMLDLDETRYNHAHEKYVAVSNWLDSDNSNLVDYRPTIYPQGSFSLGTAVKPLSFEEYDIDLVCELEDFQGTPDEIKQLVGKRLKENAIYQSRLEEMNRCWRLNYAGEFHLDILPAKQALSKTISPTAIEIPDKVLKSWSHSDPKGYATWFKTCMAEQFDINCNLLAHAEQKAIDDVPEYRVKTTLQQAVQLLKRSRDILFEKNGDDKPISVIITTLAGHAYLNQADLFETISALILDMPKYIQVRNGVHWIPNPVNPDENFADKWEAHPRRREAFIRWIDFVSTKLQGLRSANNLPDMQKVFIELFGGKITEDTIQYISEQKNKTASLRVPPAIKIDRPNKPWQNLNG